MEVHPGAPTAGAGRASVPAGVLRHRRTVSGCPGGPIGPRAPADHRPDRPSVGVTVTRGAGTFHPEGEDAVEFVDRHAGQLRPVPDDRSLSVRLTGTRTAEGRRWPGHRFGMCASRTSRPTINEHEWPIGVGSGCFPCPFTGVSTARSSPAVDLWTRPRSPWSMPVSRPWPTARRRTTPVRLQYGPPFSHGAAVVSPSHPVWFRPVRTPMSFTHHYGPQRMP